MVSLNSNNTPTAYTTKISLTQDYGSLVPVTKATEAADSAYNANHSSGTNVSNTVGAFVQKDGSTLAKATEGTGKTSYYEYSFWVMSTEDEYVTLAINAQNTTESTALTAQQVLNTNGVPSAVNSIGKTFTMDVLEALRMEISMDAVYTYTKVEDTSGTPTSGTVYYTANGGTYTVANTANGDSYSDLDSFASGTTYYTRSDEATVAAVDAILDKASWTCADATAKDSFTATDTSTDAALYYYSLMQDVPYGVTSDTTVSSPEKNTALTQVTTPYFKLEKGQGRLVTVKIWLEGTDKECFDSCVGQNFTFDFKLTSQASAPDATLLANQNNS